MPVFRQACGTVPSQLFRHEVKTFSGAFRIKGRKLYSKILAGPPYMIPFVPVESRDSYTLRLLQPHPIARTTYTSRGDGYLALGSYMSGDNKDEIKYPETHPIVMSYRMEEKKSGDWLKMMHVYLHQEDNSEPPALPNNENIDIDIAGGVVIAAKKFQGNATQEVCERCYRDLLTQVEADFGPKALPSGALVDFQLAQYGPLHSLSPRLNEIWITIKI